MDRSEELVAQTKALTDGLTALPGAIGKAIGEAMAAVRPNPATGPTVLVPEAASAEDAERTEHDLRRKGAGPQVQFKALLNKPSAECSALELEIREKSDSLALLDLCHRAGGPAPDPRSTRMWGDLQEMASKALSSSASGSGSEFIPTEMSSNIMDLYRLERRLADMFDQVDMPTSPYDWPVGGISGLPYLIAENTGDTGEKIATATPTTTKVTFTAARIGARCVWSRNFDERNIGATSSWIQRELTSLLRDGLESALLNGDTAGTHMDTVVTSATDCRKAFNGLRKLAKSPSTDTETDLSTFSEANTAGLRKKMGKYGVRAGELIFATSPKVYSLILGNVTSWPSFQTIDKVGPRAINVTGEVGAIYGSPLVVTDLLSETFNNASVDAGTGTDGEILCFNRRAYGLGTYGALLIEADYDIETQQYKLVASLQADLEAWYAAATNLAVSVGYNISTA